MKDYCECCGNSNELVKASADKNDGKTQEITICRKCLNDYKKGNF